MIDIEFDPAGAFPADTEGEQTVAKTTIQVFGITLDPTDIEGSLVAGIDQLIESRIRSQFPSTAGLTKLNPAIEANVALGQELVDKFVAAKVEAKLASFLTSLSAKYPALAPELSVVLAKLPSVVPTAA